jgi:hypothetical protein
MSRYTIPGGEPPTKDQRLKITIEGGYNETNIVTLVRSPTVPEPDEEAPDETSMVWLNQSISSLKDLIFDVRYQGVYDWDGITYRVIFDSNSTLSNFSFDRNSKQFSIDVEGSPETFGFCNITVPKGLLSAAPSEWVITIDGGPPLQYLTDYFVKEIETHTFIFFTYAHSLHTITVGGTAVVPEFDAALLPIVLMILALTVTVIAIKKRKKLDTLRTGALKRICIFASKLH